MTRMSACWKGVVVGLSFVLGARAADWPESAAVTAALRPFVEQQEIAGAVTVVAAPDRLLHLGATGLADIAAARATGPDTVYWIASMTKPVIAVAILMLQDEGKLTIHDPVARHIPELANLKTPDGQSAQPTLLHLLTHTSGLSESTQEEQLAARALAELVPGFASRPLLFEPGSQWRYNQSGINALGRIVEIASGQTLDVFLEERLFKPLGMRDTTFYPNAEQMARLGKPYRHENGKLVETHFLPTVNPSRRDRFPPAHAGLYSTALDYARFCMMLLNDGELDGRRYLKAETVASLRKVHTGEQKTGFTSGNGWGLGVCVVREPQGSTAMLSPGSYGHGGMFGTQAWIDPVKRRAYILMVQRANFPNADASDVRRVFQATAATALGGE